MTPVTMANSPIDLTSQTLLVEEIIERVEELEQFGTEAGSTLAEWQAAERAKLEGLLASLRGKGDDQVWRGHCYPGHLYRDDYFVEYVKFLAEDVFLWVAGVPYVVEIDWEKTAENLRVDYKSVDFNGAIYWFLSPPYQLPEEIYAISSERSGPAIRGGSSFRVR